MLNAIKNPYKRAIVSITTLLIIASTACSEPSPTTASSLQQSCNSTYVITPERQQFIDRITPLIIAKNAAIIKQRAYLNQLLKQQASDQLSASQQQYLNTLAITYRVKDKTLPNVITQLLNQINIIPKEIVLAQAIIESQWGESRFYKEGNNLFGMHCFSPHCGIAPRGIKNPTFNVTRYQDDTDSINAYYRNLNRHSAYAKFRKTRQLMLNANNNKINTVKLIQALDTYSEIGKKYTAIVNRTIACHQLALRNANNIDKNTN
jgi:Bax protein